MSVPRYQFIGIPEFIEAAADRSGRPDLAGPVRRFEALAAMATLCAQAAEAERADAAAILRQAAEFRDQLRVAFEAADAMLSAVARACDLDTIPGDRPRPVDPPNRGRSRRRPAATGHRTSEKP